MKVGLCLVDEAPPPTLCLCEAPGLLSGGMPALQQLEPGSRPDATSKGRWTLHIPLPSPGLCFLFWEVSSESLATMVFTDRQPSEDAWLSHFSDDSSWGSPHNPPTSTVGTGLGCSSCGCYGEVAFQESLSALRGGPLTQGPILGPLGNRTPPSHRAKRALTAEPGCTGDRQGLLGGWSGRARSMVFRSWVASFRPYKVSLIPTSPRKTLFQICSESR